MQRCIQFFLATAVVVSLLVSNAVAFNDGLGKRRMTNAERLARGLPPNPPAARHTPGVMRARDGASATTTSSSSTTSSSPSTTPTPPCTATGYIAYPSGGNDIYAGSSSDYLSLVTGTAHALVVTFDNCSSVPVSMECLNCSPPGYSAFFIVMSNPTPGPTLLTLDQNPVPPVAGLYESAIWSFDSTTSALTVEWVNSDNSTDYTFIWIDNNAFQVSHSPVVTSEFTFVSQ